MKSSDYGGVVWVIGFDCRDNGQNCWLPKCEAQQQNYPTDGYHHFLERTVFIRMTSPGDITEGIFSEDREKSPS